MPLPSRNWKRNRRVRKDAKESGKGDFVVSLDNEIAQLKRNIKELEKRTEELASMSASMSV